MKSNHCHSEGQNLKNRLFAILSKTGLRCILGASRFGAISLLQQDSDAPGSIREPLDSNVIRFNGFSSTDKPLVLDSTVRNKGISKGLYKGSYFKTIDFGALARPFLKD